MASSVNCQDLDILLVGKTGTGKSATGNTIVMKNVFNSREDMESVTKEAQFEYSQFEDRVLKVVDTPGVGDTGVSEKKGYKLVVQAVQQAMVANPEGYHVILIVVRYGSRFDASDVQTVKVLKKIFGAGFIENHGILVFTYGDLFKKGGNVKEKNKEFQQWVKNQSGAFQFSAVVKECGNRFMLFNNEKEKDVEQLRYLIQMIDSLIKGGSRYTNESFKKAEVDRQRMYEELGRPLLREEAIKKTALITQQLGKITTDDSPEDNPQRVLEELKKLKNESLELYQSIVEQDKGTGALSVAMTVVERLQKTIDDQIECYSRLKLDKEKEENDKEEVKQLELERQKLEAELKKKQKEEEQKKEERQRLEEERRRQEAERLRQIEEERKRLDEERNRLEDEKKRQEEEARRKEKAERQRLEEEKKILEEERNKIQDEKAKAELQAQLEAKEAAERQRQKEKEEEKRKEEERQRLEDERLRKREERIREEEERMKREDEERRRREKKEREEYLARLKEQQEADERRKKEKEEELKRKEEEIEKQRQEREKRLREEEKERRRELDRRESDYRKMREEESKSYFQKGCEWFSSWWWGKK